MTINMKNIKVTSKVLLIASALLLGSCSMSYLDTTPKGEFDERNIVEIEDGGEAILEGVHATMYRKKFGQYHGNGFHSLNLQVDMLTDLYINSRPAHFMGVYRWISHTSPNGDLSTNVYSAHYEIISNLNKIISLTEEQNYSSKGKYQEVMAEVYLLRAYAMSYLVQCFGKRYVMGGENSSLGIVLRTEFSLDAKPRSTVEESYAQIEDDIQKGLEFLKGAIAEGETKDPVKEKNRITVPTAYGIVARIYLGKGDYANAAKYAALAIEEAKKGGLRLQQGKELLDGFNDLKAQEWMWGYTQSYDQNPYFGGFGAHYSYNFAQLRNPSLAINRSYFDKMGKDDIRRKWFIARDYIDEGKKILMPMDKIWDLLPDDAPGRGESTLFKDVEGTGYPDFEYTGQQIKFRTSKGSGNSTMDAVFMRLGEMYYIKAEAEARQKNAEEASKTLEEVMKSRDPKYKAPSGITPENLAMEVLRNKWIDLYYEGGVFFDTKRIGRCPERLKSGNDKYLDDADKGDFNERNSGGYTTKIAKTADSKEWQFAIPSSEIEASNGVVIPNP